MFQAGQYVLCYSTLLTSCHILLWLFILPQWLFYLICYLCPILLSYSILTDFCPSSELHYPKLTSVPFFCLSYLPWLLLYSSVMLIYFIPKITIIPTPLFCYIHLSQVFNYCHICYIDLIPLLYWSILSPFVMVIHLISFCYVDPFNLLLLC